jgi:tRNA/rRNA methyltransferase
VVLGNVVFVLHRPSSAENLGAVARVLRNFGLSRLAVVEPPAWAGPPRDGLGATGREDALARARRTARHASGLLESAGLHPDLASALAGTVWACGTTSRAVEGRRRLSPRELAAELARRSMAGPVAVVLGEERRGLSDAELVRCAAVCGIPTDAAYDSMNLAQAAAVLAYEVALAAARGRRTDGRAPDGRETDGRETAGRAVDDRVMDGRETDAPGPAPGPPARHETLEALWRRLEAVLGAAGYLNPQNPGAVLAEWRALLARAEPTQREVELLVAAARALERALGLAGRGREG